MRLKCEGASAELVEGSKTAELNGSQSRSSPALAVSRGSGGGHGFTCKLEAVLG